MSVWITGPLALITASGIAFGIYWGLRSLASVVATPKVDEFDLIKITIGLAGFVGAVLAGVYAYRKQRLSEGDAHRADAEQLADRYTKATEQLGHESAAVRLGGVYAMARLADDWPEQRQVCIDVLCAYVRLPYEPDPEKPQHKEGDRAVRLTILGIISDHVQNPASPVAWSNYKFDFSGALFDGGSFFGGTFNGGVRFSGATFTGGQFSFNFLKFTGGVLAFDHATFSCEVSFDDAKFGGAYVLFTGATFRGDISFSRAAFKSSYTSFDRITLSKGTVSFDGATSTGSVVFDDVGYGNATVRWGPFADQAPRRQANTSNDGAVTEPHDGLVGDVRSQLTDPAP